MAEINVTPFVDVALVLLFGFAVSMALVSVPFFPLNDDRVVGFAIKLVFGIYIQFEKRFLCCPQPIK